MSGIDEIAWTVPADVSPYSGAPGQPLFLAMLDVKSDLTWLRSTTLHYTSGDECETTENTAKMD